MLTSISEKRDSGHHYLSDHPRYGKRAYPVSSATRKAYGIGYNVTALQGVPMRRLMSQNRTLQSVRRDSISIPIREKERERVGLGYFHVLLDYILHPEIMCTHTHCARTINTLYAFPHTVHICDLFEISLCFGLTRGIRPLVHKSGCILSQYFCDLCYRISETKNIDK